MGSITETDLAENFSFSCYELDCSIFKDDDDNESFIEINLEETQDSREFELRISISSVPVSQFRSQGLRDELRHEGQGSPASDGKTQIPSTGRSEEDESVWISTAEIPRRREAFKQKLPAVHRKLKFRAKVNGHPEFTCRDWKPSKLVTAFNSGIMKLSMKLRSSGNILTAFMSFIKSYNTFSHQSSRQKSGRITQEIRIYGKLTNPFHRWWPQINNIIAKRRGNSINNSDGNVSFKLRDLQVGSSSSSTNSSPIRRDPLNQRTSCAERENSVRAAIDHCKRSPHDAFEYFASFNNVCD